MENYKTFEQFIQEQHPEFNEEAKYWIDDAIKKPGALKAAAKKSGESQSEYCKSPPSKKASERCNLAKRLKSFH